jgi:hypothetical protein
MPARPDIKMIIVRNIALKHCLGNIAFEILP